MAKNKSMENSPSSMKGCPKGGVVDHFIINGIIVQKSFTKNLPYNPALQERAKQLRKARNLSEVIFWQQVHKLKFYKIDFDRQRIIGNYIVDFYIKSLSLVIEIDGFSHNVKEEYDAKRQLFLESLGLIVYRIEGVRVKRELGNVMEELEVFIVKEYTISGFE